MKLPIPESTKGVWTRGYMLKGGFFGFRSNLWVVWVRAPAMLGTASPAPSGSKASPAQTSGYLTQRNYSGYYLSRKLFTMDTCHNCYCPQGRMCFFTRTNFFPNKQNKSHKLERIFIPFERQLQGRAGGKLGLIWAR